MSRNTIQQDQYSCVFSFSSRFAPETALLVCVSFLLLYLYFSTEAGSIYALLVCLGFIGFLFRFVLDSGCDGLIAVDSLNLRWLKRRNNIVEHLTLPLKEIDALSFKQPALRIWGWGKLTVSVGNQKMKMMVFVPIGMRGELDSVIDLVAVSIKSR